METVSRDPTQVLKRIVALIPPSLDATRLQGCLRHAAPEAAWEIIGMHCQRLFGSLEPNDHAWLGRIIAILKDRADGVENDSKFMSVGAVQEKKEPPQEEEGEVKTSSCAAVIE